jgi:excinuclease ABC subunit C
MNEAAENLEFELAQDFKNKISIINKYQSKSTVVSNTINNVDVFSVIEEEKYVYVNYFKIIDGAILQSYTMEAKKGLDDDLKSIFIHSILYIRDKFDSLSREIIVPFEIEDQLENVLFVVPKQGDKKKLLDLSYKNLKYYQRDKQKQRDSVNPERYANQKLIQLQKDLHLKASPEHIEGFDNSNIQGTNPVASCVVFKNGKPAKRDYRHFKIKTVEGPDDFASMEEIIYRRYKRLKEEEQDLPQLIVIDGGKGQLNAAVKSLKALNLYGKIGIIGIAKKLEEIYFPGDSIPLYLDKNSSSLKLIQQVRNESHRFGLLFHRQLRSKGFIQSELSEIKGVGEKTIEQLIQYFGSVEQVKKANWEEINKAVGKEKQAKLIYEFFQNKNLDV